MRPTFFGFFTRSKRGKDLVTKSAAVLMFVIFSAPLAALAGDPPTKTQDPNTNSVLVTSTQTVATLPQPVDPDPLMTELRLLRVDVQGIHSRLDSVDSALVSLSQRVERCVSSQAQIDGLIAELACGDQQIAVELQALCAGMQELHTKLDSCQTAAERAYCEMQCASKYLDEANCILCKLPGNIKRAKVRAFIVGFAAGMGLSFGVGGAGGALSVPIW